jgi:hypothetical protein
VGVGHKDSFFFAMAILLLGGNLDDFVVEIVTDTEWGEARLKFCCFSIKLLEPGVEEKEVEKNLGENFASLLLE